MRIIAEFAGIMMFLGLMGLGAAWLIDNIDFKKTGGKLWQTVTSAVRGNTTTTTKE